MGSRFCNGASACLTDVQCLAKAAVGGDHSTQHLVLLLLGGVLGTHVCYSELQSIAPPWLSCACWGSRGEGAAQEVLLVLVLGAVLKHEPWSLGFVLMKQGFSPTDECCKDQTKANPFLVVAGLLLCASSV